MLLQINESTPWAVLMSVQLLNLISGNPGIKQQPVLGAGGEVVRQKDPRAAGIHITEFLLSHRRAFWALDQRPWALT